MRPRPRPLRSALRTLIAACGLMLALLAALQFFPQVQEALGLKLGVRAQQLSTDSRLADEALSIELPEDELAETPELSGSAAGRSPGAQVPDAGFAPEQAASTVEVEVSFVDDAAAVPPPPGQTAPAAGGTFTAELQQLNRRFAEWELRTGDWERTVNESVASHQARLVTILERLEAQDETLAALSARLTSLEQPPPKAAEPEADSARISIRSVTEEAQTYLVIEAREASLAELLARLGELSGLNLLVAPNVTGTISLHLKLTEDESPLETICRIHHCRQERTGEVIVVSRVEAPAPPVAEPPETITKLYRLKHRTGAEIRPFVVPLMTPNVGSVNFATIRERVGRKEYRDPPRAILVKDVPRVLAEVDRLVAELDERPEPVKPPTGNPRLLRELFDASPSNPQPTPPRPPQPLSHTLPQPLPAAVPQPLPTGVALPGQCLDCEVFELPVTPITVKPGR